MIPANDNPIHARSTRRPGSAMILVVVLTVLLSLIGLMFILASRIEQATSLSANVDRDLSAGVDSVVDRVNKVLVDDLFGRDRKARLCDGTSEFQKPWKTALVNEAYDSAQNMNDSDLWLSPVEPEYFNNNGAIPPLPDPDITNDTVNWLHPTDLYYDVKGIYDDSTPGLPSFSGIVGGQTLEDSSGVPNVSGMKNLIAADADGDGVWDSVWIKLPNISSAKGQPLYSAVRIIDNCAMLNLNTAFKQDAASEGQYLSAVDYERFLRSRDRDPIGGANGPSDVSDPDSIRKSRLPGNMPGTYQETVASYHTNVIERIENPYYRDQNTNIQYGYRLFDLADELEIRNRYLLTSIFVGRFEREDIAYETFDLHRGGSATGNLKGQLPQAYVKRVPFDDASFNDWKWRVNPANFDDASGAYFDTPSGVDYRWAYDRRHVCTFYSFDRNIRSGQDLVLDPVIEALRTAYEQEVNANTKAKNLTILNTVRSVFWAPNGSTASTRDLAIANTPESRKAIVHLLYALRAYYLCYGSGLTVDQIKTDLANPKHPKQLLSKAARKAAQTVANMIDYLDDTNAATPGPFFNWGQLNPDPTFIDEALVEQLVLDAYTAIDTKNLFDPTDARYAFGLGNHVVYGFERQPFLAEIYREFNGTAGGNVTFAIELCNPYKAPINLNGWQIRLGKLVYPLDNNFVVPAAADTNGLGRLIIWGAKAGYTVPLNGATERQIQNFGIGLPLLTNDSILLRRPVPNNANPTNKVMLTVDWIPPAQVSQILATVGTCSSKRDDQKWCFAVASSYVTDNFPSLGRPNNATVPSAKKGYQMPVADDNTATVSKPIATLGDFDKILTIGSEWITADDPNAITNFMGLASNEGDVRTDIVSAPEILKYVGFLNRPSGNLPGRININTASKEVIRAAIPPNSDFGSTPEDLAKAIINSRKTIKSELPSSSNVGYTSIADLLKVDKFAALGKDNKNIDGSDPSMIDDIEERDWILSRLSNIFTVRSDTFTAYIAIRIGAPRVVPNADKDKRIIDVDADRRYIAIFDRSAVDQPDKSPRLVALHPVPDPR